MERIRSLIEKLNEQVTQHAPPDQLLVTVQMLQNEIAGSMKETDVLGTSGVAVFVPNIRPLDTENVDIPEVEESGGKQYFALTMDGAEEDETEESRGNYIPSYEELMQLQEELGLQQSDSISEEPGEAVANDEAKPNKITDLRKDIDPNDRITFVRELFRGDEIMFERSIRTIDNFTRLEEAEHWIRRELRTKNGWRQGDPVAARFEQLVRQRFLSV